MNSLTLLFTFIDTITTLRDPYAGEHESRVAILSARLGTRINFSSNELYSLAVAARLHDVGKFMIPEHILNKQTKLTSIEMDAIRRHSLIGERIVQSLNFPDRSIGIIVGQHHENYDGSGYPRGERGGQILRQARVIRIVDTFDAMTSPRPYRPSVMLKADALSEMAGKAGAFYDPEMFQVFKGMAE